MGCDIHFVIERKRENEAKYIGIYSTSADINPLSETMVDRILDDDGALISYWSDCNSPLHGRNYDFFGKLAGVRRDGPEPNGVPDDVSDLTQSDLEDWDGDGHSHGHTSLYAFIHTWLSVAYPHKLMLKHAESAEAAAMLISGIAGSYEDVSETNPDAQYRVVYWFDN